MSEASETPRPFLKEHQRGVRAAILGLALGVALALVARRR
jgi:hypothetical protein